MRGRGKQLLAVAMNGHSWADGTADGVGTRHKAPGDNLPQAPGLSWTCLGDARELDGGLGGGLCPPRHGLGPVTCDAVAVVVAGRQVELGLVVVVVQKRRTPMQQV